MRQPGEPSDHSDDPPAWFTNTTEWGPAPDWRQRELDGSTRRVDPGGWYSADGRGAPPEGVDPRWIEIPHETMRKLRASAYDDRKYRNVAQESFNLGQQQMAAMTGHPVHLVDGKWYLEVRPHGVFSADEARKLLNIQEQLEVGSYKYDAAANRIDIWEGEGWLTYDAEAFVELGIVLPDPTWDNGGKISPQALQQLKDWLEAREEEDERLALRRALEEAQAEEDS